MYFLLIFYILITTRQCISHFTSNLTLEDTIKTASNEAAFEMRTSGPWSSLLEDWTLGYSDNRQERIVHLSNSQGYYISNRIDNSSPPNTWTEEKPPPQFSSLGPNKIANRPPQYNFPPKQKPVSSLFNPSPPPPRKEVTETDLYLLSAIEKLVYRVDFMEKRLKKAEELIYYLNSGIRKKTEPCPDKFTRVGTGCYNFIIIKKQNWKAASNTCKDLGGYLAEMETIAENQDVVAYIQTNENLKGKDFWTGGLNPGLLWIWSNSARPVNNGEKDEIQLHNNTTNLQSNPMNIRGNGRCLQLAYNPAIRFYNYLGFDCASEQNYICEKTDKSLSNEINRLSKSLNI